MRAGISTACLYPLYTEESLRAIASIGPACVELFFNSMEELTPSYVRDLRAMADSHGILITSVHPYLSVLEPMFFFSQYDRRFCEGLEVYHKFYHAANLLGADAVVFHGDYKQSALPRPEYFERFDRLWRDAAAHGVSLCQENVERCSSRDAAFIREMRNALPHVEYILDVKQAIRAGEDPFRLADIMGERLKHLHLSDHREDADCLLPGQGVLNIRELLAAIAKNGFSGSVIVELYRQNFGDLVELSAGFTHVANILSTLA